MQTRDAPQKVTPLPPPPAPPSRDANPWSWPEEANGGQKGRRDRFVSIRRAGRSDAARRPRNAIPRLGVAIGIAVLVLVIALNKSLGGDGPSDWAGVGFALLFGIVFVIARLRRARRRDDRIANGRDD